MSTDIGRQGINGWTQRKRRAGAKRHTVVRRAAERATHGDGRKTQQRLKETIARRDLRKERRQKARARSHAS